MMERESDTYFVKILYIYIYIYIKLDDKDPFINKYPISNFKMFGGL